jgi:hypothetical protein
MSKSSALHYDPSTLTATELAQVLENIDNPLLGGIVDSDPGKAAHVRSIISGLLSAKGA